MIEVVCRPMSFWHGQPTPIRLRKRAPFGGTLTAAKSILEYEVEKLQGSRVVIEIGGCKIRKDGWPYAGETPDPAIAVSFASFARGPLRYQCDTYDTWFSNIHAVGLTLERLRAIDRYGTAKRGEQYSGYAALPSGSASTPDPVHTLAGVIGWSDVQVLEDPKGAVQLGQKMTHPDAGGDADGFREVEAAAKLLGVKA